MGQKGAANSPFRPDHVQLGNARCTVARTTHFETAVLRCGDFYSGWEWSVTLSESWRFRPARRSYAWTTRHSETLPVARNAKPSHSPSPKIFAPNLPLNLNNLAKTHRPSTRFLRFRCAELKLGGNPCAKGILIQRPSAIFPHHHRPHTANASILRQFSPQVIDFKLELPPGGSASPREAAISKITPNRRLPISLALRN